MELKSQEMAECQDEFRNLSGCVIKILTAGRILQISIARCQKEAEIHSFPTIMYGKGGLDMVEIRDGHADPDRNNSYSK